MHLRPRGIDGKGGKCVALLAQLEHKVLVLAVLFRPLCSCSRFKSFLVFFCNILEVCIFLPRERLSKWKCYSFCLLHLKRGDPHLIDGFGVEGAELAHVAHLLAQIEHKAPSETSKKRQLFLPVSPSFYLCSNSAIKAKVLVCHAVVYWCPQQLADCRVHSGATTNKSCCWTNSYFFAAGSGSASAKHLLLLLLLLF